MLRQSARPLLRATQLPLNRSFSVAARRMGEGDTGAPRATGAMKTGTLLVQSVCKKDEIWPSNCLSVQPKLTYMNPTRDSWTKKEAAQESMYIRQKELEKLKDLKKKLEAQRKHLNELDAHIDALTKEHGGEQN
ncbi:hypothetical protein FQN52_005604 [Onygenales sp. PD_12]|nr:hypothetical protein FQN52_005604 [Onygenales sp. PD_12]